MAPVPVQSILDSERQVSSFAFTSGPDTAGVSVLVAVSLISGLAVVGLLSTIAVSVVNTRNSTDRSLFVRSHAFAYFLCLLICWLIQSIATGLSIQWIQDKAVSQSQLCMIQGGLKHAADIGIALWSTSMAVHAFCVSFLELRMSKFAMILLLVFGWISIFLVVGAGAFVVKSSDGAFYGVVGHWCGISRSFHQILHASSITITGVFLSMVLCSLTFLRVRGNLARDGWKLSFHRAGPKTLANDQTKQAAQQILSYPVTFAVLSMPLIVINFIKWSGKTITLEWSIFANAVYLLSGLMTVILFTTSRHVLPVASLRIGNWHFIPSSRGTALGPSQDRAEKGDSKIVTYAAGGPVTRTPPGRQAKRPPALTIGDNVRDSMASMYSAREGVYIAPMSSHWSPDTPPLPSRMSIAMALARRI